MEIRLLMGLLAAFSIVGMTTGAAQTIEKGKSIYITATGIADTEKAIITGIYPVSDDGFLNMRFVGKIPAAGLSCEELGNALDAVFEKKEIYRVARFRVTAWTSCGYNEETVVVGGQVKKPGPVAFTRELTIFQAIQAAGGIDYFGQLKRVRLIRNGEMRVYDLTNEALRNTPLQRSDTIEVSAKKYNDPD